eukprot:scaffold75269_cov57-Phaeocystis_antarctica.AAC.3
MARGAARWPPPLPRWRRGGCQWRRPPRVRSRAAAAAARDPYRAGGRRRRPPALFDGPRLRTNHGSGGLPHAPIGPADECAPAAARRACEVEHLLPHEQPEQRARAWRRRAEREVGRLDHGGGVTESERAEDGEGLRAVGGPLPDARRGGVRVTPLDGAWVEVVRHREQQQPRGARLAETHTVKALGHEGGQL